MSRPTGVDRPNPEQQSGPASDEPDPRRWQALAVCLVGGFMVLLDVSIVNVALPAIKTGLHASQSDLQWVVSGYAVTFGLVLVPSGRVGDLRGRRSVFVFALAAFTLASAACGAAPSSLFLVIARLVQGVAGGALTPQISALIQQMFRGSERGKAFGIFGAVVGISTAIGPLLGGLLIAAFGTGEGWRAVFFVNVPVGVLAIVLTLRLVPGRAESQRRSRHDFDPVGVLLLAVAALLLLLPFVEDRQWSNTAWLLVPAAFVVGVGFVQWDRRYARLGKEPVVDLSLFRRRSYAFGTSMITLYFAGFTPLFFVFTLYLQIGLQYSALAAGLAITPFALGSGVAAAFAGRVVHRFGRPLVAVGLVAVVAGFVGCDVAVHLVPSHGTGWATAVPLAIAGIGNGMVISPNQALTLSEVPVPQAGTAGGLLQTGQRIGAAVGIAAVGAAFFAHVVSTHGRDFAGAFEYGIVVAVAFVAAAFVAALIDIRVDRRKRHSRGRHVAGRR